MASQQDGGKEGVDGMDFGGLAAAEDALGVLEPMETGGFSALLARAAEVGQLAQRRRHVAVVFSFPSK
jgi:hypothetical protein